MSNYVKVTDFASKDDLETGNPVKLIKGSEINTEFNNIQTAVATKADLSSPAFSGNPTATTQAVDNNSARLATTAFVQTALQLLHPIGSVYIAVISDNPVEYLGFGTWEAFATGKTLVGLDVADTSFNTAEETGGSKDAVLVSHTHTPTLTDPGHTHSVVVVNAPSGSATDPYGASDGRLGAVNVSTSTTGITVSNSTEGVSGTNANLQPYVVVYMWKRTA